MKIVLKSFLGFLLAYLVIVILVNLYFNYPYKSDNINLILPPRPPNLPTDAFWQGGEDGGYWHSCQKTTTDFEYHCIMYSEDGKITWEDDFELYVSLYRAGKEIPMKDFQKQTYLTADDVSSFDNSATIHMQGTLILKSKHHTLDNPIPYKPYQVNE